MNEIQLLEDLFYPFATNRKIVQGEIRLDDAFGDIQARSLEQINPVAFKRRVPGEEFDKYCMTKYDLVLGKTSFTNLYQDSTGTPSIGFGTSDDIPESDVSLTSTNIPIFYIYLGVSVSQNEINAIKAGSYGEYGNNLLATKVEVTMQALDEMALKVGLYGVPSRNVAGLLTDSNVPVDNSTFDFYASTDALALAENFLTPFYQVWENSNGREKVDTALLPLQLFRKFDTTFIANDGKSAMQLIKIALENFGVDLFPCKELKGAELRKGGVLPSNSTKEMMLFYKRKADERDFSASVERHGTNFYSYPWVYTPEYKYKTMLRQDFTPVLYHYPGSALRVTFNEP